MSDETVITLAREAIRTAVLVGGPVILAGLVVGLIVSVFQAVTQIQEQTLSFLPKLLIMVIVLLLAGPWMLRLTVDLATRLWGDLPSYIG